MAYHGLPRCVHPDCNLPVPYVGHMCRLHVLEAGRLFVREQWCDEQQRRSEKQKEYLDKLSSGDEAKRALK